MRQDAGVDGDAQRISQLVWMFFMKIYDDKEYEYELMNDNYKSPIPEKLRWRNWAKDDEGMTGDDLLEFVNNEIFKTLKDLAINEYSDPRAFIVKEIFEDAYNYMKSGTLIRQVANKINQINFNKSEDRHIFNDIYEKILKDLQSAGNAGEYYTPRAVTQFMADMMDLKLGDKVLDPACGTGGFLTCALENIRKNVSSVEDRNILQKSITGIEKKPLPHLLAITNLILHDIEVPNIRRDNSLSRPIRDISQKDRVDVIIMMRKGGRAGIVLPDGFLFGEGVKTRIKEKLLSECNLHTIVRLPNGVFNPYTGINTNLLLFIKGEPTEEIWYFEHPLPEGYKNYTKTRPIRIEEFDVEKAWWDKREVNQYAWKVTIDEIKTRNYNLDIKNPHIGDTVNGDPEKLLKKYQKLLGDVSSTRTALKKELMESLGGK
jgi:type I restriction enzyme M protein